MKRKRPSDTFSPQRKRVRRDSPVIDALNVEEEKNVVPLKRNKKTILEEEMIQRMKQSKLFNIPILRWGEKEDASEKEKKVHQKTIKSIQGTGFQMIKGYILLDSDDPYDFFEALPQGILEELEREHGLQYDRSANISYLVAKLQPGYAPDIVPEDMLMQLLELTHEEAEQLNYCLLEGIQRGYVTLQSNHDLDKEFFSGVCYNCEYGIQASVRDCVFQPLRGVDYKSGGNNAAVICDACGLGNYVHGICIGKPEFFHGMYHNHCLQCPGKYGQCADSLASGVHCNNCLSHYTPGPVNFPCSCKYLEGMFCPW